MLMCEIDGWVVGGDVFERIVRSYLYSSIIA